jgi:C1A family cysteine protease
MGSAPSKPVQHVKTEDVGEKWDKPAPSLPCAPTPTSADGSLSLKSVSQWEAAAAASPKTQLARTILSHSNLSSALVRRQASIADAHVFNTELDFKTGPITDQKSSGRCWLFATTNVLRYEIMKKLNLKEFQLSQARTALYRLVILFPIDADRDDTCSPIYFSGISSTRPTTTLSCRFRKPTVHSTIVLSVTFLVT